MKKVILVVGGRSSNTKLAPVSRIAETDGIQLHERHDSQGNLAKGDTQATVPTGFLTDVDDSKVFEEVAKRLGIAKFEQGITLSQMQWEKLSGTVNKVVDKVNLIDLYNKHLDQIAGLKVDKKRITPTKEEQKKAMEEINKVFAQDFKFAQEALAWLYEAMQDEVAKAGTTKTSDRSNESINAYLVKIESALEIWVVNKCLINVDFLSQWGDNVMENKLFTTVLRTSVQHVVTPMPNYKPVWCFMPTYQRGSFKELPLYSVLREYTSWV